MGRNKNALREEAPYYELACWLRNLRWEARLTYRQMAGPGPFSASTLSRADSGGFLPRLDVVQAYAESCGATRKEARAQWERAIARGRDGRNRLAAKPPQYRGQVVELIYEPAGLLQAMHELRLSAGLPSLRELERRARVHGAGALPRSSLAEVLAGTRMPAERQLLSFVLSCGQPDHHLEVWREAWFRASATIGKPMKRAASPEQPAGPHRPVPDQSGPCHGRQARAGPSSGVSGPTTRQTPSRPHARSA